MHIAATSIRARVLDGFDDPAFGPDQWDELLHTGDTDVVHLTWHWQRAWWETLGEGELLLIAAERRDRTVALAPFYVDSGMIGFVGTGESPYMDFIGDISDPEILDAILETARERVPHLEGFRFYAVLEGSRTGRLLRAAAQRLGMACYDENRWPARVANLAGHPEYMEATEGQRLTLHQFREGGAILLQLPEFFEQHIPFLEQPQREFLERLTEVAARTGWLRFTRLDWEERPVAFEYGWCYRGTHFRALSTVAGDLAHRSLDRILLRQTVRNAIDEGARTYDFGPDDDAYKLLPTTQVKYAHAWGLYPSQLRHRIDLAEHPAVKAWRTIRPEYAEPTEIERLKKEMKAQVFRLRGVGPNASAVIAKRCDRVNGLVERTIYEDVLPCLPGPTLQCFGYLEEPNEQFCWLFVEDAGEDAAVPSDEYRALAARWLATLHQVTVRMGLDARLPDRGPAHYLEHLRAARDAIVGNLADGGLKAEDSAVLKIIVAQCDIVESHWSEVERFYARMPRTLVHGDFVQANVRVRAAQDTAVFLPFDWEVAGWGVPAIDLAQFTDTSISPEHPVSPDLTAYCSATRASWPHLDLHELKHLADFGTISWLLANICWESKGLDCGWMERSMKHLRAYQAGMAESIRTAGWES